MFFKNIKFFLPLLLFFFTFCDKPQKQSFRLISENQMVEMIMHMHIQEAFAQQQGFSLIDSARVFYYQNLDSILTKKGYSRVDFDSSFAYYSRKPIIFQTIYQKVIDSLSVKEIKGNF